MGYKGEQWRAERQRELAALYREGGQPERVRRLYAEIWEDAKLEAAATGKRTGVAPQSVAVL